MEFITFLKATNSLLRLALQCILAHFAKKLDADLEGKDIVISPAAGRGGGGAAGRRGGGAEGGASGLFPPVAYFLAACAVNTQQAAKLPCEFECWQ